MIAELMQQSLLTWATLGWLVYVITYKLHLRRAEKNLKRLARRRQLLADFEDQTELYEKDPVEYIKKLEKGEL